jgi:hypothetical protein
VTGADMETSAMTCSARVVSGVDVAIRRTTISAVGGGHDGRRAQILSRVSRERCEHCKLCELTLRLDARPSLTRSSSASVRASAPPRTC